ncbi:MAG: hypothetical protein ABF289_03410 [Clostridiales bacterium]
MSVDYKIYRLQMGPAKCGVDLGDGSERGEYVSQDYILKKLLRPHRNINLMYCYYPLDNEWPLRASKINEDRKVSFAWDYKYDDYFPYEGGITGNTEGEPFKSIKDIRKHGQDVTLTLTIDCGVSNKHLKILAQELKSYGRMQLRINHEATGTWFAFNKRYTYKEVGDFYVRFHNIIKEEAPNISTILCIGSGPEKNNAKMPYESEFEKAIRISDIWSGDYYLALNWGWPFVIAETGGNSHKLSTVDQVFEDNRFSFERFKHINNGIEKPLVISEFNADGDVTGPFNQCKIMNDFYMKIKNEKATWLNGITFYQFRDRGRLGLEIEDPNNKNIGIEQPILETYKKIIQDPYFMPEMKITNEIKLPFKLRWGSFEDSEGIAFEINFESNPIFFEINFEEKDLNLMIEINNHWFYKAPGVKTLDLMEAFFKKSIKNNSKLYLKIFAPPTTGENKINKNGDWLINNYTNINKLPSLRIRYEAIEIKSYSP